jgi:Concanavalin A-like lectin/glucanases superfamily
MLRTSVVVMVVLAACDSDGGVRHLPDGPEGSCNQALAVDEPNSDVLVTGLDVVPASGFTWELWFNATTVPTSTAVAIRQAATLVSAADPHSCEDIYVGFGSEMTPANELTFSLDGVGACGGRDIAPIHGLPSSGVVAGKWYFVAVTHDYGTGASMLYLDGVVIADKISTVTPITGYTLPVSIGRWTDRSSNSYNQFHGAIDEVVFSGRAFSGAEVMADYGDGHGRYRTADEPDLIAGYHLDEGSGTVASDFGVGMHAGALEAGAGWQSGIVCP